MSSDFNPHPFRVFPSLQSLLCGPSLSIGSVLPLLERLSEETLWGFSLHLLCATRRGQYESSIKKLLDRCPQAIIAYANHQLQDKNMVGTERWPVLWRMHLPSIFSSLISKDFLCLIAVSNLCRPCGGRSCSRSFVLGRGRTQTAASFWLP